MKTLGLTMMWSVPITLFVLSVVFMGWLATLIGYAAAITLIGLFVGGLYLATRSK